MPITCALPPPQDRALSDVWSALGGELKPSLDLVVVVPFDLSRPIEVGVPVLERTIVSVNGESMTERRQHRTTASRPIDVPPQKRRGRIQESSRGK
jgi:hypothetical protein